MSKQRVRGERISLHQLVTHTILQSLPGYPFFSSPSLRAFLGAPPLLSCAIFFLETTGGVRPQWTQTEIGSSVKYQSASAYSIKSHLDSEFIGSIDFFPE